MASKNTSIALGKPYTDFARKKVESGEFATTSEVVREAMRHYIAKDAKREALDRARRSRASVASEGVHPDAIAANQRKTNKQEAKLSTASSACRS